MITFLLAAGIKKVKAGMIISGNRMKVLSLLLVALLTAPPLANAELVELVTIYGPPGGDEFYHVCGPGDVNDDGYPEFIASSEYYEDPGRSCVSIYTT
ncbi:MAG: hypothetical protein E3J45_05430, partial [Candidatus Zixiibacteriota bacterium]